MTQTTIPQPTVPQLDKSGARPTVLVFAGLDPTGGAGIQADIETLVRLKVHALPIITCLTVQDSQNVKRVQTVDAQLLHQQVDVLVNDIAVNAVKVGLLFNSENINLVSNTLKTLPSIPVIFDPVLKAGGGANLTDASTEIDNIIKQMREQIIPYTTIITPNSLEARLLTGEQDLDDCAKALITLGCENVLITGEHEKDPDKIKNVLYTNQNSLCFDWPRLPHQYHGSGCTLASAISAYLVNGESVINAVQQAQSFTNSALQNAVKLGQHQYHPNRFK